MLELKAFKVRSTKSDVTMLDVNPVRMTNTFRDYYNLDDKQVEPVKKALCLLGTGGFRQIALDIGGRRVKVALAA